jgi:hypothetical protein
MISLTDRSRNAESILVRTTTFSTSEKGLWSGRMINLAEVGATPSKDPGGNWSVSFGIYLSGITLNKGYRLEVRVIHELVQLIRGIEPKEFFLNWQYRRAGRCGKTPDRSSLCGQLSR